MPSVEAYNLWPQVWMWILYTALLWVCGLKCFFQRSCTDKLHIGGSRTPEAVRRFMYFLLEEGCSGVIDSYGSTEFPGISNNGEIAPDVELKLIACHGGYSPNDQFVGIRLIACKNKDTLKMIHLKSISNMQS